MFLLATSQPPRQTDSQRDISSHHSPTNRLMSSRSYRSNRLRKYPALGTYMSECSVGRSNLSRLNHTRERKKGQGSGRKRAEKLFTASFTLHSSTHLIKHKFGQLSHSRLSIPACSLHVSGCEGPSVAVLRRKSCSAR